MCAMSAERLLLVEPGCRGCRILRTRQISHPTKDRCYSSLTHHAFRMNLLTLFLFKTSRTSLMCSITIIRTTPRTMCIALVVRAGLDGKALPSPCSLLTVSIYCHHD